MRIFGGHGQTDEPGLQVNLVAFLFLSRLAGILADARAAALAVLPPVQTVMSFRVMFGTAIHNDESCLTLPVLPRTTGQYCHKFARTLTYFVRLQELLFESICSPE